MKTAAVETEVWTGFEVLHTSSIGHTVQLSAQLTAAIQVCSVASLPSLLPPYASAANSSGSVALPGFPSLGALLVVGCHPI